MVSAKVEKSGYKPWWSGTEVKVFGAASLPKVVKVGAAKFTGGVLMRRCMR